MVVVVVAMGVLAAVARVVVIVVEWAGVVVK